MPGNDPFQQTRRGRELRCLWVPHGSTDWDKQPFTIRLISMGNEAPFKPKSCFGPWKETTVNREKPQTPKRGRKLQEIEPKTSRCTARKLGSIPSCDPQRRKQTSVPNTSNPASRLLGLKKKLRPTTAIKVPQLSPLFGLIFIIMHHFWPCVIDGLRTSYKTIRRPLLLWRVSACIYTFRPLYNVFTAAEKVINWNSKWVNEQNVFVVLCFQHICHMPTYWEQTDIWRQPVYSKCLEHIWVSTESQPTFC